MNKAFLQKVLFLPLASLIILAISILLADFILLPLMRAQLDNPRFFGWLFFGTIAALTLYKFTYWLSITVRKEKTQSFFITLLQATGKATVSSLFSFASFIFKTALLAVFITTIIIALAANNSFMFP